MGEGMDGSEATLRCPCAGAYASTRFAYREPPKGEVRFDVDGPGGYYRESRQCGLCRHFFSAHAMSLDGLYSGRYVDATYGEKGLAGQFLRIDSLPPSLSDNAGRVERVHAFASRHLDAAGTPPSGRKILDVGSGLCVFLHRMKLRGWDCTALDPDSRNVAHARDAAKVNAIHGDFLTAEDPGRFHLVSFNKVLEHVRDPVGMLEKSRRHLRENGLVYVEVPDGESAAEAGPGREEFFVDHWHVFSMASLALLAERAGFAVSLSERAVEPSGKFTLWAFMTPLAALP